MRCKNTNGNIQDVTWIYLKKAWVPATTVCLQKLYTETTVVDGSAPTVTTDSVDGEYQMNMIATGTITDEGSESVSEYGWVWSYSSNPTINDNKVIVGSESYIGSFTETSDSGAMDTGVTIYIRAYATNSVGTGYGDQLSGQAFSCFIQGTLITLADGSKKPIEDINYDDSLLVWNFDEGKFDEAKPIWVCNPFVLPNYRVMRFNNGADLAVAGFDVGHRIYNIQKNTFTHLNTSDTPFGTTTVTDDGNIAVLVDDDHLVNEEAVFYNIITHTHINIFANSILTSCKLNNIYPISDMKFIKDDRKLNSFEEFDVSEEVFKGLRLAEQPNPIEVKEKAKTIANSFATC